MGLGEHVLGTNDAWTSPEDVLRPLEAAFEIEFDPCGHPSNLFARTTVLLRRALVPADKKRGTPARIDDYEAAPKATPPWRAAFEPRIIWGSGLEVDWSGRGFTYVNMPFSDIEPWVVKMQDADEGVALMPARMNAGYLHEHAFPYATAVHFPKRRIQFVGAETQPPWHSMLLYYGSRPQHFAAAYRESELPGLTLPLPASFLEVLRAAA